MKTHIGSIQRKGRKFHLVFSRNGKQVWRALHTETLAVARERAAQIAPRSANDDAAWLRQLVSLGELARAELARRESPPEIGWRNLWREFEARARPAIPTASRESYRRWIELLASCADGIPSPAILSRTDAERIAKDLSATHLSAGRMLLFYRRVWRTLFHDETAWSSAAHLCGGQLPKSHEFYRRLSVEEVRRVVGHLSCGGGGESMAHRALADMVAIGYYTGLRLSDVAELDQSEISWDGPFLRIQPNKVRHCKTQFLTIPLIGDALTRVRRLQALARPEDDGFIFPHHVRIHASQKISAAFRACDVHKHGNGRASFHSLRATFISMMDESGVPPHITDAITGHAGGGMHARYTQPSVAAMLRAVQHAITPL